MSTPIVEVVNANKTSDETHRMNGHEPKDVSSAASNASARVTSEEVPRQIKVATHLLTRQLERPCDLTKELRQSPPKSNEETFSLIRGPSRLQGSRFDIVTGAPLNSRSDMLTGQMISTTRQHEQITSTAHQPKRQQLPLILEEAEDESDHFTSSSMHYVVTVINNLSHILHCDSTHTRILSTQIPNFRFQRQIP